MKTVQTAQEVAKELDGMEYPVREDFSHYEDHVIIYGHSDDLVELQGAFTDEVSAYDGTSFSIDEKGVRPAWNDHDYYTKEEAREFFEREKLPFVLIVADWATDGYSWVIRSDLRHATFNIMEDGAHFCRGIVIALDDIPKSA